MEEIRRKHPKQFDTLTKVPVRFVRKQKYSEYVEMTVNLYGINTVVLQYFCGCGFCSFGLN